MLSSLSADWAAAPQLDFNSECRFYLDPRGLEYPVFSGTPSYTAVSGAYNMPGSYWLSSEVEYLFSPGNSISGEIFLKQLTVDADAVLLRLYGGYTLTLSRASGGGYTLVAVGGSTVTCSGGTIQPIQRVGFTFTYGGSMKLYVDGTLVDTDTAPALTTKPVYLEINAGAQYVTHVRLFDGYAASDTDHSESFANVGNEEIFFSFNKTAFGRTRCNVNTSAQRCVTGYSIDAEKGYKSKSASLSLNNQDGQFSDDQYAAFAPESGSYNGTSTQKYLTKNVGMEIETWAPTAALLPSTSLYPSTSTYPLGCYYTYEPLFRGIIPSGSFNRATRAGGLSTLSVSAEDGIAELSRRVVKRARNVQDYYLSRATPSSNSVLHFIAELGTKREVYNYLTNSSFENATIGDSWATTGTLARDTTAVLAGTYCGKYTGNNKNVSQTVIFSDLTAGEQFTGSIYVYSTSAITGSVTLTEADSGGDHANTATAFTHSGKGWDKLVGSHTITNSTSDRIRFTLAVTSNVTDLPIDCAMLKYGRETPYWVLNSNSGTTYSSSGVSQIGSEMLGSYDWLGVVGDDVSYQHPWVQVEDGDNVWERLKDVCDAILARYCMIDASGVLRISSMIGTGMPTSLGAMPLPSSIQSGQQANTGNKLTVHGVQIKEYTFDQCMWMAESANIASDAGVTGKFERTIANGASWPDSTIEGVTEYHARYDGTNSKSKAYRSYRTADDIHKAQLAAAAAAVAASCGGCRSGIG